jgi:hypothetical protein
MSDSGSYWEINSESQRKAAAHKVRCRKLPPLRGREVEQLVAEFLASRSVTQCPAAYLAPVR